MVFGGYFDMDWEEKQGKVQMLAPGFLAWGSQTDRSANANTDNAQNRSF